MRHLLIEHLTRYQYHQPVQFDPHRLMLMPHEGYNVSVLEFELECSPDAEIAWLYDVFRNPVAVAQFTGSHRELMLRSRVVVEQQIGEGDRRLPLRDEARRVPVRYSELERPDLAPSRASAYPDEQHAIQAWLHEFVSDAHGHTEEILRRLNHAIREQFEYRVRLEPGVQSPAKTLRLRSGTCRDFAVLFIEAARSLGMASRFVSGYLYDDQHNPDLHGAGHTHAWAQVYLPGPGWVEFDPTNAGIGGGDLIRVAVGRDPAQAIPVQGTYRGPPDAAAGMEVEVNVRRIEESELEAKS